MEIATVNKAEEKRIRQAKETLTRQLSTKLIDFKERYLKSYVEYRFNEFDIQIARIKKQEFGGERYGYTLEKFNADQAYKIASIKCQMALTYTNTLKFITEAIESYNIKFERLVSTLIEKGVRSYPLTIEKINGGTAFDFSFLITHATKEKTVQVYARIILAQGEINAPHYRFIITVNKNLIH